jgi:hypothetical protein
VSAMPVLFCGVALLAFIYSASLHWALIQTIHSPFYQPDSPLYGMPALNLLFDGKMQLVPTRTAGYPLFLFLILKISGSFLGVLIVQHANQFLMALVAALIYYLFLQRSLWAAFFVGWITSLSAEAMAYAHMIMTENVFCLVLVVTLFFFYLSVKRGSIFLTLTTAVVGVLAVFVRPAGLGILVAIGISYVLCSRTNKWRQVAAYGCSILVLLGGWSLYNQRTKGFLGLTSHSGDVLFDSAAFLLDVDESLPPDVRQQLAPVYEQYRSRMINDWAFVSVDPQGPVQALLKLENRKSPIDSLLRSLALKTIKDHPIRYGLFLLHDLVEYHLKCFGPPNYFIFPPEYTTWLGAARFWYSSQSQPQGRALFGYTTPFAFFADHPEVAKLPRDWRGLFPPYEQYRSTFQDIYLDNIGAVSLYPFSLNSVFTIWLTPIVKGSGVIAILGVCGGLLLLFSATDRYKVIPILLVSFSHLAVSSLQGIEPRFALPVQPLYLILFVFTLQKAIGHARKFRASFIGRR